MDQKEEKLYLYLKAAVNQSFHGNHHMIDQIYDELAKKDKDKELLEIWIKAIQKNLTTFFIEKNQINISLIFKIINIIDWFHYGLESLYKNIIIQVIGFNNAYIKITFIRLLKEMKKDNHLIVDIIIEILDKFKLYREMFIKLSKEALNRKQNTQLQINLFKIAIKRQFLLKDIMHISIQKLLQIEFMNGDVDCQIQIFFDLIENNQGIFQIFLDEFDQMVFQQNNTKYVQYLILYFCQFDQPNLYELLVSYLLFTIKDQNQHFQKRKNCILFMVSFLVTANYLNIQFIFDCIQEMLNDLKQSNYLLTFYSQQLMYLIAKRFQNEKFHLQLNQILLKIKQIFSKEQLQTIIYNEIRQQFLQVCLNNQINIQINNTSQKLHIQYPFESYDLINTKIHIQHLINTQKSFSNQDTDNSID